MSRNNDASATSAPKVFTFNPSNAPIRVQVINDEPWFVAKDVCDVLGLVNSRKATSALESDEKGVSLVVTPSGTQTMTVVSESGLYNLIFQSRKPEAKSFRKWVTSEVLPSIRKTGSYDVTNRGGTIPRRYARRAELVNAEILNLLWLVGEYLNRGDQKAIALELGVSVQSISSVLAGRTRSPRILQALYDRARKNRDASGLALYNDPVEMRHRFLGPEDEYENGNPRLPVVYSGKRGGQLGNRNARKKGGF